MPREEDYLELRAEQEQVLEFRSGFGVKAMLGGLFVAFLVLPGSMFMSLMLGQALGQAAVWVTLIIFLEICKRCRATLTKQEMFILYSVTTGVMAAGFVQSGGFTVGGFIWMQYFVRSPAAHSFEIADRVPLWMAPPPDSAAYVLRDLVHRDWVPHLTLMGILIVWNRLSYFSIGYAAFRVTSDVEKLPFPMAPIAAQGITALAESDKETWRWRCFSIGSTIGIIWGVIYVGIPAITGVFLKKPLYLLPVPFIDFTKQVQNIGWLQAVPLALSTQLNLVMVGFVLPFWMVVGSFTAGVVGRLILNPLLYRAGMLPSWERGMDVIETGIANGFDFWLSFGIGTGVALALLGFYTTFTALVKARRKRKGEPTQFGSLWRTPPGRGDIPIGVSLLFYVAKTSWVIVLCHWLVPKFPIWIMLVFGFGYTPVMTYVSARLVGLTGHGVGFPYVREATFILSGYKGVDIWYAPIPLGDAGGGAQNFRVTELTGTRFTSVYKAEFFMIPVTLFASLFFWSYIYRTSDIPEDYPFVSRFWPRDSIMSAFWMTATTTGNDFFLNAIKFKIAGAGLAYGVLMYPLLRLLNAPTLFLYGTIRGLAGDPMDLFPELLAALFGRYYFARRFGKRNWARYTPILAAGYGCGIGLIGMVAIAVRLIASAVTQLPF